MKRLPLWPLLLAVLLASGCRTPLQVVTRVCSGLVPVKIISDELPIRVKTSDVPVKIDMPLKDDSPLVEMMVQPGGGDGKIALVDVDGILLNKNATGLLSAGENPVALFREKLDAIEAGSAYRGVVLRINSAGGGATATDIMRHDLMEFKKRTQLPMIACVMDVGAGGAYYMATTADQILAHPTSVVGGLGVLLNLYNLEDALGMLSIVGTPVRSGKNTDLGSPLRMMSAESREILQGIADKFHDRLTHNIREARVQVGDTDAVVFDGRVFTAHEALERGLVDQIGYLDDAIEACRAAAGSPRSAVVILHRPRDAAHTAYDVTPNQPIQTGLLPHVAGLNRSMLPTFLYIWQPDPALETSLGN